MTLLERIRPHLPIAAIVLLGGCLRMGWPAITEFKADEARLLALALDMAEFKGLALRGIGSSVGFPNFPMSVWLYSIPLLAWKHPYSATIFVGLLNTLGVYLTYWLARRYWAASSALAAALLFAASPWAIVYSRKIWAQNLLPVFVLVYAGSALLGLIDRRRGALLVHLVTLAIIAQIHLSGLALAPLTAILFVARWRAALAAWREIGLGLAIAGLTAVPFAIWLATNAGGAGAEFAAALLARPAQVDGESARFAVMIIGGFDIHSLAGPEAFRDYLRLAPGIGWVGWLWVGAVLAGLALAIRRRTLQDLFLVLWLVIPVLFFARHSTPVFPHYFIPVLPAAYILAGTAVGALREAHAQGAKRLAGRHGRIARGALAGAVAAGSLTQAAAWLTLLFFVGARETPNGFGTPLGSLLAAVDVARGELAESGLPEVLIVGQGDDPAVHEFPAVMDVLLRGVPRRYVNGEAAVVVPQGGAVVVMQADDLWGSAWYLACAREQACQLQALERGLQLVAVPPGVEVRVENEFPEPRRLANGVELIGWAAHPGWQVVWRPGFVPAASAYHFFNHGPQSQADGAGYPSRYWRDGDVYVSYFDLEAVGPVRVGMYEYPAVINVPVLDAAGLPYADALTAAP